MRLSEIKNHLSKLKTIGFQLPNGAFVPNHFHVTEVGKVSKHYIDCGGTVRNEEVASFQLWEENDYNHRLHPEKLVKIIERSERILKIDDLNIEVEYQSETISKYDLDFDGTNFLLIAKATNCLAKDQCGIPQKKPKIKIAELQKSTACSTNSTLKR
jgi:hypothetical protein